MHGCGGRRTPNFDDLRRTVSMVTLHQSVAIWLHPRLSVCTRSGRFAPAAIRRPRCVRVPLSFRRFGYPGWGVGVSGYPGWLTSTKASAWLSSLSPSTSAARSATFTGSSATWTRASRQMRTRRTPTDGKQHQANTFISPTKPHLFFFSFPRRLAGIFSRRTNQTQEAR
eukprot:2963792-Pyramimonas_sp.AAC.1